MYARKHVFRDLRPYVCTSEHCPKPDQLFERRNHWYDHEVQCRRGKWYCDDCKTTFRTKGDFTDHLKTNHEKLLSESELIATINRREKASLGDQPCPVCPGLQVYSYTSLQSHLARHMQELALFTLHSRSGEAIDEVESNAAQSSVGVEDNSVDSSEYSNLGFGPNPSPAGSTYFDLFGRDRTKALGPDYVLNAFTPRTNPDPTLHKHEQFNNWDKTEVLGQDATAPRASPNPALHEYEQINWGETDVLGLDRLTNAFAPRTNPDPKLHKREQINNWLKTVVLDQGHRTSAFTPRTNPDPTLHKHEQIDWGKTEVLGQDFPTDSIARMANPDPTLHKYEQTNNWGKTEVLGLDHLTYAFAPKTNPDPALHKHEQINNWVTTEAHGQDHLTNAFALRANPNPTLHKYEQTNIHL